MRKIDTEEMGRGCCGYLAQPSDCGGFDADDANLGGCCAHRGSDWGLVHRLVATRMPGNFDRTGREL